MCVCVRERERERENGCGFVVPLMMAVFDRKRVKVCANETLSIV